MTKPQALPFLAPVRGVVLGAGRAGAEFARAAAIGLAVIVVLWLPFIAAGGPRELPRTTSAVYQNDIFRSCRSGPGTSGGSSRSSRPAASSPRTTSRSSARSPSATSATCSPGCWRSSSSVADRCATRDRGRSSSGLAASTLIAFCFLTQMHERYAYGALVFLMLLLPERPIRALAIALRRRVHAQPAGGRAADARRSESFCRSTGR